MNKEELNIITYEMDNERLIEILKNSNLGDDTCTEESGRLLSRNNPQKALVLASALAISPISNVIANDDLFVNQEIVNFNMENYTTSIDKAYSEYIQEIKQFDNIDINAKNDLIRRIISFKSLNENWDGNGALPTEVQSASNAIILMNYLNIRTLSKVSDVYPTPHGTVTIYWENKSGEALSLEVGNNRFNYYLRLNSLKPVTVDNVDISEKSGKEISKLVAEL